MTLGRASGRTRLIILALHVSALVGGCAYAWSQFSVVTTQQAVVDQAQATQDQLNARLGRSRRERADLVASPYADALIEAPSATVAGAILQGQVVSAIRGVSGTVTSSQIDLSGNGATPPVVILTLNCQIANAALQGLLYNLERRTPAMFLDQLSIQPAASESGADRVGADPLTLAVTVSAFWKSQGKS